MKNEKAGEIIADIQAHLEELVTKLKGKKVLSTDDIEEMVNLFEEEADVMQDYGWALYLANESKEEYKDRKGDY